MKVSVIFHSVCGNTYLMAKEFNKSFVNKNQDVSLCRVADSDWQKQVDVLPEAGEHLEEMMKLPVATPEIMFKSDLVIIGSPTYFGNVSGEMKAFMDSIAIYWFEAKLAGKKLAAFTSAGNPQGGGGLCLQAIHTFGQHMGMISIPVPVNLMPGADLSSYGIIHYSNATYVKSLDEKAVESIDKYVDVLLRHAA